MTDDEARQLPVTVDATTLRRFVSSTWMTDAGPIDVLGDLPVARGRRGYDELMQNAVPRQVHGIIVQLASLDEIIASKEAAARDKDRQALPELYDLQRRQSDDER